MKSHVLAGLGLCCIFYCTAGRAQQDTTAPVRKDTTVQQDATVKKDTSKPAGVIVADTTKKPTTDTSKPKQDTGLILPPDSNTIKQELTKFTLTGTVQDSSQTPIPGAKVLNKKSGEAVMSDPDGKFTIKAAKNDTIIVSAATFGEQA